METVIKNKNISENIGPQLAHLLLYTIIDKNSQLVLISLSKNTKKLPIKMANTRKTN